MAVWIVWVLMTVLLGFSSVVRQQKAGTSAGSSRGSSMDCQLACVMTLNYA